MKIEAVVVDGKVYTIEVGIVGYACQKCAFYKNGECLLDDGCPLHGDEYLKKGESK